MPASQLHLLLLAAASLLATGCYCPALSGRYSEVGCFPACPPYPPCQPAPASAAKLPQQSEECLADTGCCLLGGKSCLGSLFHRMNGPVPSRQHDDYVSPAAKFHPVPTRPVFAPEIAYPLPVPLDPHP
jgi:hypothetical protein